jgi:hypothetical protein
VGPDSLQAFKDLFGDVSLFLRCHEIVSFELKLRAGFPPRSPDLLYFLDKLSVSSLLPWSKIIGFVFVIHRKQPNVCCLFEVVVDDS